MSKKGANREARWRRVIAGLKSSTILSNEMAQPNLSLGMMRRLREAIYPSVLVPAIHNIKNPYHYAKARMNDLWSLSDKEQKQDDLLLDKENPLTKISTMRGAMAAYWTGEQLKESLKPTLGVAGLVMFTSVNVMFLLEFYGETLSAILNDGNPWEGALKFGSLGAANIFAIKKRVDLENNLKKNMTFWLREQFSDSVAQELGTINVIAENKVIPEGGDIKIDMNKSSPQHAMERSTGELANNLIDTGVGGLASITTAAALTYAIAQDSVPVPMLGDQGTLWIALGTIGPYSLFTYMKGAKMGKAVEVSLERKQKAETIFNQNVVKGFDKKNIEDEDHAQTFLKTYREDNKRIYDATTEHDILDQRYKHFMEATGLVGFYITPITALAGLYLNTKDTLTAAAEETFFASSAQAGFLLGSITQVVNLFASKGRVTVPAKVISDMAREFIDAQEQVQLESTNSKNLEKLTREKSETLKPETRAPV